MKTYRIFCFRIDLFRRSYIGDRHTAGTNPKQSGRHLEKTFRTRRRLRCRNRELSSKWGPTIRRYRWSLEQSTQIWKRINLLQAIPDRHQISSWVNGVGGTTKNKNVITVNAKLTALEILINRSAFSLSTGAMTEFRISFGVDGMRFREMPKTVNLMKNFRNAHCFDIEHMGPLRTKISIFHAPHFFEIYFATLSQ